MRKTKNTAHTGRFPLILAGILLAALLLISVLMGNTAELNTVLDTSTNAYVKDVSYQMASDLAGRIEAFEMALEQLADSIPRLQDKATTEEFLERKARLMGMDTLVILGRDGTTIPQNFDSAGLQDHSGIRSSFDGNTEVVYVEGENLLFSTPIYTEGQVNQVLAGVREKKNMQELIQPKSFGGEGLTCIVDSNGEIVISPTDSKPFLQLEDIFESGENTETANAVSQMQADIAGGRWGVFQFTAVDGSQLVLAYQPLHINDWVLLTLVPADLISEHANLYAARSYLIVGGIVLVFILLLLFVVRFYRRSRKKLEEIAFTDSLTGGMNNTAFQLACKRLTEHAAPGTYTVVLLNIKGFKLINEKYGIDGGNDILRHVYSGIKQHIQSGELAARGEADRFFLCLKEQEPERVQARLDEMIQTINTPTEDGKSYESLTILQGACPVTEPELEIAIIQDRARTACQLREEARCVFYSAEFTQRMKREKELDALFDKAIVNRDFRVFLQPKVYAANGKVGGAEALIRWIDPERGMIYPSDFIPLFERNGKIVKLDFYVFEEVCKLLHDWNAEGRACIPVSVNLSRVHFKTPDFLSALSAMKEQYQIPDGLIEFELTESIFFDEQQIELVKNAIVQMHSYGFLCSLDDFGVGFSSLGLLKEFAVDAIKLDRKFFGDIANSKSQIIIESFVRLAEKLGIHVVAEGIETPEQLTFLREIGCEMIQGYIYAKPLPMAEFEAWCETRTTDMER